MILNDLLTAQEEAVTLNGATTNATSGSHCLDFFSQGGAMRNQTESFIKSQFEKAWEENPQRALKILGWIYDCRGGCGERDVFYHCFMWLIEKKPEIALWVIHQNLIPEYGRWDMLIRILNASCPEAIEKAILEVIAIQLNKDSEGKQVSLCGKWMPREDKKYGKVAKKIRKFMGLSAKTYRKLLVKLTNVVEQQMCRQQWQEINYSQVPSRASLIYRNAFNRHDSERYVNFLQEVEKGKTKINANQLYPYDLIQK